MSSKDATTRKVHLESQVALKIMQHCNECLPHLAPGLLLGLDVGQTLEVTGCFPSVSLFYVHTKLKSCIDGICAAESYW
jgi:hypothetical protein